MLSNYLSEDGLQPPVMFVVKEYICQQKSGFRVGRYDSRDYIYLARQSPENSAATGRIIIEHDVPVVDQGNIVPCCVSVAVTTCLEVLDQNEDIPLSFMYNYYWARTSRRSLGVLDIRQGLDAAASSVHTIT